MWTRFYDMCSGGDQKLQAEIIWVEAGEVEASEVFERVFQRDPFNVTCECCGADYSVSECESPDISVGDFVITRENIAQLP